MKNIFKNHKDSIHDLKKVLTFLTVDFYNHDTQHSSIAEGVHTNYNFQISFKVLIEEVFLQYLEHDFIKIELYVSEGMDAFLVGKANISLKDLTNKMLGEGIAPALSSSLTLYGENNEIIGVLNFRMRMK